MATKKISLALYSVRVRPAYTREYETISSFSDDADLFNHLQNALAGFHANASNNTAERQVFQVDRLHPSARRLEGIISSGEYGAESTIRDVNTWTVSYRKRTHDAEMLPFYFLLDLPEGRDKGLLLLQRTGILGIRHVLGPAIERVFRAEFDDYMLVINPIVPGDVLEKYIGRGSVMTEIRFIRNSLSADITNAIGRGTQHDGSMELVVKLKETNGFPFQPQVRRFLQGRRRLQDLIELEETRFAYDNVKIRVRINGEEKIIDLGNPQRLRSAFDVTQDVRIAPSGHPTFDSLSDAAHALMDDISANLYGTG
jgi:hypothetical protein